MAVSRIVGEMPLDKTLSGLSTTSKGQLRYDRDWHVNGEISDELSCSFDSYLQKSPDSLNTSLFMLTLDQYKIDESECSEKESESCFDTVRNHDETSNKMGVPIHFDIDNERNLEQYFGACRGDAEQRKALRMRMFERWMENLKNDNEKILKSKKHYFAQENREFEIELKELLQKDANELQKRKVELDEETMAYKQRSDEIFKESLMEESLAAREREQRCVMENLKNKVSSLYQQVATNIEIIQNKFADSKHMSFVDAQISEDIEAKLDKIQMQAKSAISRCEVSNDLAYMEDNLETMQKLVQTTLSIEADSVNVLKLAQEKEICILKKKQFEEAKQMKLERDKQEQLQQHRKLEPERKLLEAKNTKQLASQTNAKESKQKKSPKFAEFISDKALVEYTELQEHLNTVQESFKNFVSDPTHTKYKFDLQKAVNNPINALSASPIVLNDKIRHLVSLLSGNNVQVFGKKVTNCKGHPSALVFCKDLVAKMLVLQGARQVSFDTESAFYFAAVIVAIWTQFPDVGKLILAYFHRNYPYLVPYYMPRVEGQSNNDYHKALGYHVSNHKIEHEDHFLKKFSGTVQLYAAVVSSKGASTPDHPHGIHNGWTFLARTLNLKPQPNITATMMFEFIKIAGHLLMQTYHKQFQKLLLLLFKEFLPAIDKVTPAEKRGPAYRFKDFLQECVKTQKIAIPKGYLTERWWQTGHF